jgi:hypothetical protein
MTFLFVPYLHCIPLVIIVLTLVQSAKSPKSARDSQVIEQQCKGGCKGGLHNNVLVSLVITARIIYAHGIP